MVCRLCGRNVATSSGTCPNCDRLRDQTITSVLTPPPAAHPDPGATTYPFRPETSSPPNSTPADDEAPTRAPIPTAAAPSDDAPTGLPGAGPVVHRQWPDAPTRTASPAAARSPDDT